jgi:phosphoserine phosphatase
MTQLDSKNTGKNKELGLPFGGMEKVAICFDVDGTLIDGDKQHHVTLALLGVINMQKWKNVDVVIWSGGGADYARTMIERTGFTGFKYHSKLEHQELRKKYAKIIAIDDIQDTAIGDINLIVRNK